jgi:hypothetical protein
VSRLRPDKLHVRLIGGAAPDGPVRPRCYTLTHSDWTGDLYLTIGPQHDWEQIEGRYTRLMRDEVLAGWCQEGNALALRVHCHVSGGLVLGSARWRDAILHHELPLVLEAFRYGDRALYAAHPALDRAPIWVCFHAAQARYDRIERWGVPGDYVVPGR